ncbi:hypothetical protein Fleli_3787 [Bernardetia litoralis DSM 6794]|uniref:Uncharacterized protein n=1 Tax=Bernardetia litoralis (strain ATCC 23117 / DSM 6794 / NBRC 15988 / NCIMB 1366 / Fx l1 / Sio-4) TaxID=880071 RepID=I4AQ63_BERLS|nr:hypothetical protein [Bernardetia litoralis]AFM06098.1 hypothetical protein Fleli_3787 [Bernardetia litoralis DSM 6794]
MIQKQVFKNLLLVLFLLNSSFILAQNETYWAITEAFPIKYDSTDLLYKKTVEKARKEIQPLIIQNGKIFLWTNCFSEIEKSIKNTDCKPIKLPKDYQNIELVGDSLLYIKLPLQDGKEFFLIYQKLGKKMPQSEILKYENTYLSNKDSLILLLPRGDEYLKIEHYFKNIYKTSKFKYNRIHTSYYIFFIEKDALTVMHLASNINDTFLLSWLDFYENGVVIEKELENRFEKSDIEDFLYAHRRKYSTHYFKINQK